MERVFTWKISTDPPPRFNQMSVYVHADDGEVPVGYCWFDGGEYVDFNSRLWTWNGAQWTERMRTTFDNAEQAKEAMLNLLYLGVDRT